MMLQRGSASMMDLISRAAPRFLRDHHRIPPRPVRRRRLQAHRMCLPQVGGQRQSQQPEGVIRTERSFPESPATQRSTRQRITPRTEGVVEGGPGPSRSAFEVIVIPQVPPSMLQKITRITQMDPEVVESVLPTVHATLSEHVAACIAVPLNLPGISKLNQAETDMYAEVCANTLSNLTADGNIVHGHMDATDAICGLINDERGSNVLCSLQAMAESISQYATQQSKQPTPQEQVRARAYAFVYSLEGAMIPQMRNAVIAGTVIKTMARAAFEQLRKQEQNKCWNVKLLALAAYNGWAVYHLVRNWLPEVTPLVEAKYAEDKARSLTRCNVMLPPAVGLFRREHFVCIYTDHGPNARVYVVKNNNNTWCMPGMHDQRKLNYASANVLCALIRQVNLPPSVIFRFARQLIEKVAADVLDHSPTRVTSLWFVRITDDESLGIGQTSSSLLEALHSTDSAYEWKANEGAIEHNGCFVNMQHLLLEPVINAKITDKILRHLCPSHMHNLSEWFSFSDVPKCYGNMKPCLPLTMILRQEYIELNQQPGYMSTVPKPTLDGWLLTLYDLATGSGDPPADSQFASQFADLPIARMMAAAGELLRFVEPTSLSLIRTPAAANQYAIMYGVNRNGGTVCRNKVNHLVGTAHELHSRHPQSFMVEGELLDLNGGVLAQNVLYPSIDAYVAMQRAIFTHDVDKAHVILAVIQSEQTELEKAASPALFYDNAPTEQWQHIRADVYVKANLLKLAHVSTNLTALMISFPEGNIVQINELPTVDTVPTLTAEAGVYAVQWHGNHHMEGFNLQGTALEVIRNFVKVYAIQNPYGHPETRSYLSQGEPSFVRYVDDVVQRYSPTSASVYRNTTTTTPANTAVRSGVHAHPQLMLGQTSSVETSSGDSSLQQLACEQSSQSPSTLAMSRNHAMISTGRDLTLTRTRQGWLYVADNALELELQRLMRGCHYSIHAFMTKVDVMWQVLPSRLQKSIQASALRRETWPPYIQGYGSEDTTVLSRGRTHTCTTNTVETTCTTHSSVAHESYEEPNTEDRGRYIGARDTNDTPLDHRVDNSSNSVGHQEDANTELPMETQPGIAPTSVRSPNEGRGGPAMCVGIPIASVTRDASEPRRTSLVTPESATHGASWNWRAATRILVVCNDNHSCSPMPCVESEQSRVTQRPRKGL